MEVLLLVLMDLMVVLRLLRMVVIPELLLMLLELVVMVTKVRLVMNTEETMIVGLKRQKNRLFLSTEAKLRGTSKSGTGGLLAYKETKEE